MAVETMNKQSFGGNVKEVMTANRNAERLRQTCLSALLTEPQESSWVSRGFYTFGVYLQFNSDLSDWISAEKQDVVCSSG